MTVFDGEPKHFDSFPYERGMPGVCVPAADVTREGRRLAKTFPDL